RVSQAGAATQVGVLLLQGHRCRPAVLGAELADAFQPPRTYVGPSDVSRLARRHESGERLQRLLQRRGQVVDVDVVQVDTIGLQAAEAAVDRRREGLAARTLEPLPRDLPVGHAVAEDAVLIPDHAAALGGQEHVVSAPGASEPPSQQLLALSALAALSLPPAVAVSRVEEVSTGLDVPVEHLYGR